MKYILLTTILFASCLTEKKSVKQLALIQDKFPKLIAQNCADKFSIRESIEVREVIKLDTILNLDTITKDSVINNEVIRYVYLPGKTITKTIHKDSIIRLENTAKLFVLTNQLKVAEELINEQKHKLKTMRTILYIIFCFISIFIMLKKIIW